MKKFVALMLTSGLCFHSVCASPLITVTDSQTNAISVSGHQSQKGRCSVLILNPGYTSADANGENSDAIADFRSGVFEDGYRFNINLAPSDGGVYTVIVNDGSDVYETAFAYYPEAKKLEAINKLNSAQNMASVADEVIEIFGLSHGALYTGGNKDEIYKAIENAVSSQSSAKLPDDVDLVYNILAEALLCAAYNSDNESLVATDGKILYADTVFDIELTEEYEDYIKNLSDTGRQKVNSMITGGQYKTLEDVRKAFYAAVSLCTVTNYKESGFGHVMTYLEKYKNYFEQNGIYISDIKNAINLNGLLSDLAGSDAKSPSDFISLINSYTSSGSSSSSGAGGGFGGGGGGSSLPVAINPGTSPGFLPSEKTVPFEDIGGVEWAVEAICELYDKKVINGKSLTVFDPSSPVTRAEFVKMTVLAFGLASSGETTSFADVDRSAWYAPYVDVAFSLGIVSGVGEGNFKPDKFITREESAVILCRLLDFIGFATTESKTVFSDENAISDWAKDSVKKLHGSGFINGRGDNLFAPSDNITRAESAKLIYEMTRAGGSAK